MSLTTGYHDLATRSVAAAHATLNQNVQEATGFYAYHAFESLGGAVVHARGGRYPSSHVGKINSFVRAAGHYPRQRYAIGALAIELSAARNRYLYPRERPDGTIERPQDFITSAQAGRLLQRVNGICNAIGPTL